jgi:hypothetical protein
VNGGVNPIDGSIRLTELDLPFRIFDVPDPGSTVRIRTARTFAITNEPT